MFDICTEEDIRWLQLRHTVNLIRLAYLKEIKTSAYKNSPVLVLMS
jgi:hypothetical protein